MRGVARVLRVDLSLVAFHRLLPDAGKRGFGRTFRSPTLWEDMVKTITNCNMKWSGTVRMNMLLCNELGREAAFPTPKEVLAVGVDELKQRCKLGYRAQRVRRLALAVEKREGVTPLDLKWLEDESRTRLEVFKRVKDIYGFGNFAAHNVCQLLGHFDSFPYDSETARHFKEHHRVTKALKMNDLAKLAARHYSRYAPYQFLAYWFELWQGYEARRGTTSTRWSVCGDDLKGRSVLFDVSSKSLPPSSPSPSRTPKKRKPPPESSTPDGGKATEGANGRHRHSRRMTRSGSKISRRSRAVHR
mmetsp:Transcript_22708/g.31761  ORF Transcript_22708/g.31761 Transcript_22708/m.31761 type:complete len:302 (+) Transcript_22708:120-1025(+)